MPFSACQFTDTTGTNLTAHNEANDASPVGAGAWTTNTGSSGSITITSANRGRCGTANTRSQDYKADTPSDADYSVFADLVVVTASETSRVGVTGRCSNSADTAYVFRANAGAWNLHRRVAGSATDLTGTNNVGYTFSDGQTYHIELRMVGTVIQGYVNGSLVCDCTDSNISATGFPGLYAIQVNMSDAVGVALDNWHADNTPGGDPAGGQDTPELYGRPYGARGQSQMQQLLAT